MSYIVNLETFSGSVKKISLPSKGAVAQFISNYPNQLPVGISVKISCDKVRLYRAFVTFTEISNPC